MRTYRSTESPNIAVRLPVAHISNSEDAVHPLLRPLHTICNHETIAAESVAICIIAASTTDTNVAGRCGLLVLIR